MPSMHQLIDLPTLDRIMDDAPLSIEANATAIAAVRLMHQPQGDRQQGFSYVLVVEASQPVGILTARDVVVRLVASGVDLAQISVTEVMTQPHLATVTASY
jgi:CBS domain-containing protein